MVKKKTKGLRLGWQKRENAGKIIEQKKIKKITQDI
jgi:hypothetical protein